MLSFYDREIRALHAGCGDFQSLGYGLQGAAVGGAEAVLLGLGPELEATGVAARATGVTAEEASGAGVAGAASETPAAVLYQKLSASGEHLKYGITRDPATRYSSKELNGGRLNLLAQGSKSDMLGLERDLHETLPVGPEEGQLFYIQKQIAKGSAASAVSGVSIREIRSRSAVACVDSR